MDRNKVFLTQYLYQMGILSHAIEMHPILHAWEEAFERTEKMEFEDN